MIKAILLAISVATVTLYPGTLVAKDFVISWNEAHKHSAVSYWYKGEDSESYYITENWPSRSTSYKVEKTKIVIDGIKRFRPCKYCKGTNLKRNNIRVLQ